MSQIYRLRPSNDQTLDELKNNYLWFSRPSGYKDVDDSNVIAFTENNEPIKNSFDRIFTDTKKVGEIAGCVGICCFTKELPPENNWKDFPKGHNGIFIEYDKNTLDEYFVNNFGIGDCFKNVEYLDNPLVFDSYSTHDVVWEITSDGIIYKSLREIENNPKLMDGLFLRMFTRINRKYDKQKEQRIILGGRNIPDTSPGIAGYKISIPSNAIKKIYLHSKTPSAIVDELEKLNIEIIKPSC